MYLINVKALISAFNQEKALVGAFSVVMKTLFADGSFAALAVAFTFGFSSKT